ncbi:ABC transporter ATP-binding protein [Cryobacterium sp. TMT2-15-1]|uniref:ABC transporter ATP-binding protein n=1 Tax=Cryobacterium sp. TMT2-15-1 TaxID=1259246 RepID=UPI00106990E5|nr:ABC transporter ATP-binding protein [Cryobacterium sp. TMT2-15-1]TFC55938.1 ABC transporter ATP-binding protein [Cryobacterium sp. TMT2-15-1]
MKQPATIISVTDVSKRFVLHKDKSVKERLLNFSRARAHREDFWALKDISLDIATGSTVGLVGHNGSGKSTLLKVIGGIIQPTTGSVLRRGRMAALLELGAGFHPDLTGRENVYLNAALLGLSKQETDREFDEIVEFSGIEEFIDTQVKFYSSGMYVRLAFSVAIHVDPDVLLVDEVLAVGDEPFQRKCMDKIAQFQSEGRTIVLVSHSSEQVGRLCDRVVVLDKGKIMHDGDPTEGIRILREGYDAASHRVDTSLTVPRPRTPYSLAGARAHTHHANGRLDLEVDIDVDVNEPQDHWGIGLSIENTLGMNLYGMTTFTMATELPNTPGRHMIRLAFPDIHVGTGKYLVNVGLGDSAGTTFDRRSGVTSFNVVDEGPGNGILSLRPEIVLTADEDR